MTKKKPDVNNRSDFPKNLRDGFKLQKVYPCENKFGYLAELKRLKPFSKMFSVKQPNFSKIFFVQGISTMKYAIFLRYLN